MSVVCYEIRIKYIKWKTGRAKGSLGRTKLTFKILIFRLVV